MSGYLSWFEQLLCVPSGKVPTGAPAVTDDEIQKEMCEQMIRVWSSTPPTHDTPPLRYSCDADMI